VGKEVMNLRIEREILGESAASAGPRGRSGDGVPRTWTDTAGFDRVKANQAELPVTRLCDVLRLSTCGDSALRVDAHPGPLRFGENRVPCAPLGDVHNSV
jgi:hypothetical protein